MNPWVSSHPHSNHGWQGEGQSCVHICGIFCDECWIERDRMTFFSLDWFWKPPERLKAKIDSQLGLCEVRPKLSYSGGHAAKHSPKLGGRFPLTMVIMRVIQQYWWQPFIIYLCRPRALSIYTISFNSPQRVFWARCYLSLLYRSENRSLVRLGNIQQVVGQWFYLIAKDSSFLNLNFVIKGKHTYWKVL